MKYFMKLLSKGKIELDYEDAVCLYDYLSDEFNYVSAGGFICKIHILDIIDMFVKAEGKPSEDDFEELLDMGIERVWNENHNLVFKKSLTEINDHLKSRGKEEIKEDTFYTEKLQHKLLCLIAYDKFIEKGPIFNGFSRLELQAELLGRLKYEEVFKIVNFAINNSGYDEETKGALIEVLIRKGTEFFLENIRCIETENDEDKKEVALENLGIIGLDKFEKDKYSGVIKTIEEFVEKTATLFKEFVEIQESKVDSIVDD